MKYTIAIILMFSTLFCFSQNCYRVEYKGVYVIPGEYASIHIDSATEANLSHADSNWKVKLIEKTSSRIVMNLHVRAEDSVTYMESKITEQPSYVQIQT